MVAECGDDFVLMGLRKFRVHRQGEDFLCGAVGFGTVGRGVKSGEALLAMKRDGIEHAAANPALGEQLLAGIALGDADDVLVVYVEAAGLFDRGDNAGQRLKCLGIVVGMFAAGRVPCV